jgi:pimeloyl-ACP methyl ester carboxylesterase
MNITGTRRRTRLRLSLIAAAAASAALLVPLGLTASAHTIAATAPAGRSTPKPTIVLVHGAWASTSSWNGVISRLHALGYTVYAPPNPLMGLTFDDAYLASFMHSISGPRPGPWSAPKTTPSRPLSSCSWRGALTPASPRCQRRTCP